MRHSNSPTVVSTSNQLSLLHRFRATRHGVSKICKISCRIRIIRTKRVRLRWKRRKQSGRFNPCVIPNGVPRIRSAHGFVCRAMPKSVSTCAIPKIAFPTLANCFVGAWPANSARSRHTFLLRPNKFESVRVDICEWNATNVSPPRIGPSSRTFPNPRARFGNRTAKLFATSRNRTDFPTT